MMDHSGLPWAGGLSWKVVEREQDLSDCLLRARLVPRDDGAFVIVDCGKACKFNYTSSYRIPATSSDPPCPQETLSGSVTKYVLRHVRRSTDGLIIAKCHAEMRPLMVGSAQHSSLSINIQLFSCRFRILSVPHVMGALLRKFA
jgi:hypothetical protein